MPGNEGMLVQEHDVIYYNGSAHEARDGATETHQGDAIEPENLRDNNQQVLDDDADDHDGPDRAEDHTSDLRPRRGQDGARDRDGNHQQDDAHDANVEHHDEHNNRGDGSHHCGE